MTTPRRRPAPGGSCPISAHAELVSPAELVAAAVADNVAWCACVARAQGVAVVPGAPGTGVWATARPMPVMFPSAVTTRPGVPAHEVAAALPPGPVGVKDAFADLDLTGEGFTELLQGRWLVAGAVRRPRAGVRVGRVRTLGQRTAFAAASGHRGLDWTALQADPTVDLVVVEGFGRRGWEPAARAVVSSGSAAVGISNLELDPGPDDEDGETGAREPRDDRVGVADVWCAVGAFAARRFPGRLLVGWEPVSDVAGPVAAGFVVAGPLRVWVRG